MLNIIFPNEDLYGYASEIWQGISHVNYYSIIFQIPIWGIYYI